jgi:hypothetical protein
VIRGAALALTLGATSLGAQKDSTKCDSIVGAARVGDEPAGLFLSVNRMDGSFSPVRAARVVQNVGAAFTPPKPFQLNVFSGPSRPRLFRRVTDDTAQLRSPTVTGVYRTTANSIGEIKRIEVIRPSLMPGFDSSAVRAIRATVENAALYAPMDASPTATFDIKFSTDSSGLAVRLFSADFPAMRMVDATPLPGAPSPMLPDSVEAEGDVLLRFVVHRDGKPDLSTVEVLRTPSVDHLKAAFKVLPEHRFKPATIAGCAVAQRVDYAFVFRRSEPPKH